MRWDVVNAAVVALTLVLLLAACNSLPAPPGDLGSGDVIQGPPQFYDLCATDTDPGDQPTLEAMGCPTKL